MIPVHIINLEHRTDRKTRITEELIQQGIFDFRFVTAVNDKDLKIDQMIEEGLIQIKDRRLRDGEYGCYMSHLHLHNFLVSYRV